MSSLLRVWVRRRRVRTLSAFVCSLIVVGCGLCGWRLHADAHAAPLAPSSEALDECRTAYPGLDCRDLVGPVDRHPNRPTASLRAGDLVEGHRYLLAPLAVIAIGAAALSGSVVASDGRVGLIGVVVATAGSRREGLTEVVVSAALGAALWAMAAGGLVVMGGLGLVALQGEGGRATLGALPAAAVLLLRSVVSAAALGSVGGSLALVAPGASWPAMTGAVGPVIVEGAVLLGTRGAVRLLPGGLWTALITGALPQASFGDVTPRTVSVIVASVWVALPLAAGAAAVLLHRYRPLPRAGGVQ